MKVFLNALWVLMIITSSYLVYGAFFRDFPQKYRLIIGRYYPWVPVRALGPRVFAIIYKAMSVVSLAVTLGGYFLLRVSGIL